MFVNHRTSFKSNKEINQFPHGRQKCEVASSTRSKISDGERDDCGSCVDSRGGETKSAGGELGKPSSPWEVKSHSHDKTTRLDQSSTELQN